MFDIAWSEFLVVAVVALIVVGPRELPALLRTVGKAVASLKRMAGEFQTQFNDAMREAELDDLKNEVTGLKNAANKVVGASPFQIARDEIRNALNDATKPTPSALAGKGEGDASVPSAFAPPPPPTVEPPPASAPAADAPMTDAAALNGATPPAPEAGEAPAERPAVEPGKPGAAA